MRLLPDMVGRELPVDGAVRVHPTPDQLPARRRNDETGPYRFDDPRSDHLDSFRVRYLASTLRGCLLEVLAGFRPMNDETAALLVAVQHVDEKREPTDVAERGLGVRGHVKVPTGGQQKVATGGH